MCIGCIDSHRYHGTGKGIGQLCGNGCFVFPFPITRIRNNLNTALIQVDKLAQKLEPQAARHRPSLGRVPAIRYLFTTIVAQKAVFRQNPFDIGTDIDYPDCISLITQSIKNSTECGAHIRIKPCGRLHINIDLIKITGFSVRV